MVGNSKLPTIVTYLDSTPLMAVMGVVVMFVLMVMPVVVVIMVMTVMVMSMIVVMGVNREDFSQLGSMVVIDSHALFAQ